MKVDAITVEFRGEANISKRDDTDHRLVISRDGAEVKGASNDSASSTISLKELTSDRTRVPMTSKQLSDKVARFGQGMIQDVSNTILRRFVNNLESDLGHEPIQSTAPSTDAPSQEQSKSSPRDVGAIAMPIGSFTSRADEALDVGVVALPALWAR